MLREGIGWTLKTVNESSWLMIVSPTDRPKSVRNRCVFELFVTSLCHYFAFFVSAMRSCHITGSDLLFIFS